MKYYRHSVEVAFFEKEHQIENIGISYYLENYLDYTALGILKNITNEHIITNENNRYHIASDIIAFFIQENILYDLLKKDNQQEGGIKLFCKIKEGIVIDLIAINETETTPPLLIKHTEKQFVKAY